MNYLHILLACANEPWALERSKLLSIASFLAFKASGKDLAAEDVARITQKREREVQKADGNIGILLIRGVIGERMNMLDDISGGTSSEMILKQFRSMLNDSSIKAIIMDVDSPGGAARSTQEVADEIFAARGIKPIIAQVNTCAASAAYWLACQADEIVVTPSGQAGSIGVYTMHEDISEMLAQEGIKETLIYSGEYKVMGNSYEPLSEEAKSIMQQRVDQLAGAFVQSVARGRNVTPKQVNESFGQGLMFNAQDLLDRDMADRIAPMSETLERFGVQLNPALSRARAANPVPAAAALLPPDDVAARLQAWCRRLGEDELPPPSEFEAILRDVGMPKSRRALVASKVHAGLRSESGENAEATSAIERLRAAAKAFSPT